MIADGPAPLAATLDEADGDPCIRAMVRGRPPRTLAADRLEAAPVVDGHGLDAAASVGSENVVRRPRVETVPATVDHARRARTARGEHGRGTQPARLDRGGGVAHAPAKPAGEPLPLKGGGVARTGIEPALKD